MFWPNCELHVTPLVCYKDFRIIRFEGTLVYRIEVQAQINMQVGEFLKIYKSAVRNKCAAETSCKKSSNVQDFNRCSVIMK